MALYKGTQRLSPVMLVTPHLANIAYTGNYADVNYKPQINSVELVGNKTSSELGLQALLVSGTNIKTVNNNSLLGSGNINIDAGGGANLTPLEVPGDYMNLMEFINGAETPETYTISNDNDITIDIDKEDTTDTIHVSKGSIISVFPSWSATILTADGQYTYFNYGDYLYGGVSINNEEVEAIIDEKLGSDVVMANTDQTISGQKKFTSTNGTTFENGGGVSIRYIYSSPPFKIIPDNIGNIDFYYNQTLLGRIDAYNSILYRALRPNLNETVDLGTSSYNFNKIYAKSLVSDVTEKIVANLVSSDSNLIPVSNNFLSIGNTSRQWSSLYLANTLRFDPQSNTKIENLKNLTVNTINLGQQRGGTTLWDTSKFLQYDATDVKCKGKLYGGLDVNNQAIHNVPDPDNDTSPVNKGYADTNYQGTLTFDSVPTDGSTNPVTSDGVYDAIQNVTEVAEGKTATYTLSYATTGNTDFNSQNASITVSSFVDTAGNTITDADVKVGDIVLVVETDVPDRWVQSIDTTNHTITLYKMETSKIDLTNYVDLTSAQTITGVKTMDTVKVGILQSQNYGRNTIYLSNTDALFYGSATPINNTSSTDLGSATNKWRNLYLRGDLTDGTNSIAVEKIANVDDVVDLTSAQTISGNKTFSGTLTAPTIKGASYIEFRNNNGVLATMYNDNTIFNKRVQPNSDNAQDLGTSTKRWKDLYLSGNLTDGTNSIAVNKIANKDNFVTLSQADYDALVQAGTVDANTFYFIEEV